jgi:hypothetical protein
MDKENYYSLIGKGKNWNRLFLEQKAAWNESEHPQEVVRGYVHMIERDAPNPDILILHDWGAKFGELRDLITEVFHAKEVHVKNCYHFYEAYAGTIGFYFGINEPDDDGCFFK